MRFKLWLLLLALLAGCDSEMVAACEDVIKDRLKSPSSYQRVAVRERASEVEIDRYRILRIMENANEKSETVRKANRILLDYELEDMRSGKKPLAKELVATFEYDAANAFGVLIRGYAECKFISAGTKPSGYNVQVDGSTQTDWLVNRMKAAR
jgi:hypothetical protein